METGRRARIALLCACAAVVCVFAPALADPDFDRYKDTGSGEVRHEMESLVDGVKDAMRNAGRARDHKEVIDLGQSLHILEHKFAGLKQAIAHELGTKLPAALSHSEESKRMLESTSRLLDDVAAYRQDMQKLMVSVREIDDSLRAVKEGMATFDQEVDTMNRLLADLHVRTNELHENHQTSSHQLEETTKHVEKHHLDGAKRSYRWYYLILVIEVAAVAYYLYSKRDALPKASAKHFSKFG